MSPATKTTFPHFRRIGRIMMSWRLRSNKSPDWRDATNASTSDEWFDSLDNLLDDSVRAVLDCDQPPMLDHIASLPLKGDQAGAYAGILTPLPSRAALLPCVYTGCALRAVKERMSEHDSPKSLTENPDNKYYQMRHSTYDYAHKFVTLASIPIDGRLPEPEKIHRRLLCRVAETFFTIWLVAIDGSKKSAVNLLDCAQRAYGEAYGITSGRLVAWDGFATHSPLKEQTGTRDYRVVANGRYDAAMNGFGEIYGGRDKIPSEIEALAKSRSQVDTVRRSERKEERKRSLSAEELAGERQHQKRQKKARRDAMTVEEEEQFLQDNSEYHAAWRENKKEQMNEEEKIADKAADARKTRKHKIMKLFNAGQLTKSQLDDIEANDWKRGRGNGSIAKRKT